MSYGVTSVGCDATAIMQYTGFKDGRKKEIYDGDVLRLVHNGDTRLVMWKTDSIVCRDIYDSWLEINVINRCKDVGLGFLVTFDIEIIGNIYENPELMTQEKVAK